MRQLLAVSLAVLVLVAALRAAGEPPDKGKTPRERYEALFEEYYKATQRFMDVYKKAKNEEERSKVIHEKYPQTQSYVRRFLEIADSAPQDEAATDSLIWIVQRGTGVDVNSAIDRLAAGRAENFRGTIGKTAQAELNEIRNPAVGKPAPEIAGEDTDGKPFKLSDYKGKVVVVDFWGDW
jgi:hypothetical protein